MSQVTKCDEGHFYDKSLNTQCPHCGIGPLGKTKKFGEEEVEPTVKYRAGAEEDEKTRMYGSGGQPPKPHNQRGTQAGSSSGQNSDITVGMWSIAGIDPVVGWLVCHEGANQGRDYRVRSGYNTIGRDTSSQICIAGDDTIARIEHARIFFDRKTTSFHLIAGSGRSGAYVNDQVVLQSAELKPFDILEIGSTKLIFVPFCGDKFRWDMNAPAEPPKGRKENKEVKKDKQDGDDDWMPPTRGVL
jgi:hypothetical protein